MIAAMTCECLLVSRAKMPRWTGSALANVFCMLLPLLAGCAMSNNALPSTQQGVSFQGKAYGGQQPIVGAHVYLYAANDTGYGGPSFSPTSYNASISLLSSSVLTNNPTNSGEDANSNYYVTSKSDGSFTITGDYTCTTGQQLYIYSIGGDPGGGVNSAAGIMAALGSCSSISSSTSVTVDEASTIALAYASAGFASDALHISSSSTALSKQGIANAFAMATNLVDMKLGLALASPASNTNGTAPQQEINTLANILAACVNTAGPGSSACSTLLPAAASTSGTTPTDTATAAINIAQNPAANVMTLYGIPTPGAPFGPVLTAQPNDWTVVLNFPQSFSQLSPTNAPPQFRIDNLGNAWVSPYGVSHLYEFSPLGASMAGFNFTTNVSALDITPYNTFEIAGVGLQEIETYTAAGTFGGAGAQLPSTHLTANVLASDHTDIWLAYGPQGSTFSTTLDGPVIFTTAQTGLKIPQAIALDASLNAWVNDGGQALVAEISSSGTVLSGSGYTSPGMTSPSQSATSIAIDQTGAVWVIGNQSVVFFIPPAFGLPYASSPTGITGGGLYQPQSLAMDGADRLWVRNYTAQLIEYEGGTVLSGATGYQLDGRSEPANIAIDGSGNVWSVASDSVQIMVGAATPVVTPLSANLTTPYNKPASMP